MNDCISRCEICNQFRSSQTKESMMLYEVPDRAWSTVTDIFEFNGTNFIIVVDHFSNYFEYEKLTKMNSMSMPMS